VQGRIDALVARGGNLDYDDPQTNETIGGINDWIARVCPLSWGGRSSDYLVRSCPG
jgi:hypothetical protein